MKFVENEVVFSEIPNEITLAVNISNCPIRCKGCHSKHLWDDIGEELNEESIDTLINKNNGITCFCFMGGDRNPEEINILAEYIKEKYSRIKVGWYSGREYLASEVENSNFDYIKLGRYIEERGPINKETTNQRLYEIKDGQMIDITYKMFS